VHARVEWRAAAALTFGRSRLSSSQGCTFAHSACKTRPHRWVRGRGLPGPRGPPAGIEPGTRNNAPRAATGTAVASAWCRAGRGPGPVAPASRLPHPATRRGRRGFNTSRPASAAGGRPPHATVRAPVARAQCQCGGGGGTELDAIGSLLKPSHRGWRQRRPPPGVECG
jgi:hypothetical protein